MVELVALQDEGASLFKAPEISIHLASLFCILKVRFHFLQENQSHISLVHFPYTHTT